MSQLDLRWTVVLVLCLAGGSVFAGDWPHWRGAGRNDVVEESSGWNGNPWPVGEAVWTRNVAIGCSSPIVVGSRVYVMGWGGNKDHVWCLDSATGNEIWRQSYACPKYGRQATGDQGIYAGVSSTPEFDSDTGWLYTLSLDGHLNCWDTKRDGAKVWGLNLYDKYGVARRPDVGRNTLRDYGFTSSPLVHGDWLLVEVGAKTGNLIAFSKRTGDEVWKSECHDEAGHTAGPVPMLVEQIPCVAVLTLRNLVVTRLDKGHAGETVAQYPWTTDFGNNIPTPAVHGDEVIITTAYNQFAICKLRITLAGATEVWKHDEFCSGVCTPVIHKGHVYWAWRGIHCLDLATGKLKWKGGKIGTQGSCIVTGDDRLIVWSNRGDLQLVETAERSPDELKVLAEKRDLFRTDAWPHVVLADGQLYCKDRDGNLHCYRLSAQ